MKRVVEVEMETKAKKFETALSRFFRKYPELNYWKEQFEYMYENGKDFDSDIILGNGERNKDWAWALHLDNEDDFFFFCVIERA